MEGRGHFCSFLSLGLKYHGRFALLSIYGNCARLIPDVVNNKDYLFHNAQVTMTVVSREPRKIPTRGLPFFGIQCI